LPPTNIIYPNKIYQNYFNYNHKWSLYNNLPFVNYLNPHIYNAGFQNLNDCNNLDYLHKYNIFKIRIIIIFQMNIMVNYFRM